MEKELIVKLHTNFEGCVREKDGVEFWYARELQKLLGYDRWENFENAISKAKVACENSKQIHQIILLTSAKRSKCQKKPAVISNFEILIEIDDTIKIP